MNQFNCPLKENIILIRVHCAPSLWPIFHMPVKMMGTLVMKRLSRGRGLRPCASSTSWEKRFTVSVCGRVQKEERCVGQSEGRVSMEPGSLKRRILRGLPARPSSAPMLSWALDRFFFKSWKQTGGSRIVLSPCGNQHLCVFLLFLFKDLLIVHIFYLRPLFHQFMYTK